MEDAKGCAHCGHVDEGPCCFIRRGQSCGLLSNTYFRDGFCHFRKKYIFGPNLYDEHKKQMKSMNGSDSYE